MFGGKAGADISSESAPVFWWGLFVSVQCCTPSFPTTWPPASLARPCSSSVLGALGTLHCNGRLGELAARTWTLGLAKIGIGGFLSSFLLSYLTPHLHALYSQSSPIGRLQQRARQRQAQALPTYLPYLDLTLSFRWPISSLLAVALSWLLFVVQGTTQGYQSQSILCQYSQASQNPPPDDRLATARDSTPEVSSTGSTEYSTSTYTKPTLIPQSDASRIRLPVRVCICTRKYSHF